jgi:predicted cobalt transporter CbtA
MVEYALLLAHNSAAFFGGIGGDVFSWASGLNWGLLGYAAAGLVLLRMVSSLLRPTRRY